jgi:hypothetical protein
MVFKDKFFIEGIEKKEIIGKYSFFCKIKNILKNNYEKTSHGLFLGLT